MNETAKQGGAADAGRKTMGTTTYTPAKLAAEMSAEELAEQEAYYLSLRDTVTPDAIERQATVAREAQKLADKLNSGVIPVAGDWECEALELSPWQCRAAIADSGYRLRLAEQFENTALLADAWVDAAQRA